MKRGGRPKHESYQELAFIFKKVNEKCVAECMASHKVLQNTAKERFKTHLKYCIISEDENEDSVTNSIMEVDKTQSMAAAMSFSSISLDEVLLLNNNNLNPIEISKEVGKSKEDAANLVILVPPDTKAAKTAGKVVSAGSNIGKQRRIKSFMDYIDETGKRKFDYDLTNSLFASNIDPDVVESDYFKSFVKGLCLAYVPPSTETILSELLDKAHEQFLQHSGDFANTLGILFISKVKCQNTDSILAVLKNLDGKTAFLKSFEISDMTDYSKIVLDAISLVNRIYKVDIFTVHSKELLNVVDDDQSLWYLTCNVAIANNVAEFVKRLQSPRGCYKYLKKI